MKPQIAVRAVEVEKPKRMTKGQLRFDALQELGELVAQTQMNPIEQAESIKHATARFQWWNAQIIRVARERAWQELDEGKKVDLFTEAANE